MKKNEKKETMTPHQKNSNEKFHQYKERRNRIHQERIQMRKDL